MANEQNNGSMQMQGGMGNGSSGDYGMMRSMQGGSAMRSSRMMQGGTEGDSMQGGDSEKRRAKKEYRAKMKRYKAKHNEAKEVFRQITKKIPETRKEAEELYEMILSRGSNAEKARAAFAVADFCWACDEKEAEKEVREEVDDFDTDED